MSNTRVMSMDMERFVVKDRDLQRKYDSEQMADWVNFLAPWDVISHLTFKDRVGFYRDGTVKLLGMGIEPARRNYEKFMSKHLAQVSYFYALEQNPSRDGYHVHALWADAETLYRKEAWSKWFQRYGRARIEPVKSQNDVAGYCSKYCTKECAWWNVKLQWHHVQRINGTAFSLANV